MLDSTDQLFSLCLKSLKSRCCLLISDSEIEEQSVSISSVTISSSDEVTPLCVHTDAHILRDQIGQHLRHVSCPQLMMVISYEDDDEDDEDGDDLSEQRISTAIDDDLTMIVMMMTMMMMALRHAY